MTQGVAYTPAMQQYILDHKDHLFYSEIAYNLSQMTGMPVTRKGIIAFLHRTRKNGNGT